MFRRILARVAPQRYGLTTTQSLDQQSTQLLVMQVAATATGNGTAVGVAGYLGAQQVELLETGGGTATVVIEGSNDGSQWYTAGYQQVDGTASLTRSVLGISVSASSAHVYQVLDPYRQLRARISAIAGGGIVTARVYAVPA